MMAWRKSGLSALIVYAALSCIFFGVPILTHFSTSYIGQGIDPTQFMWFLNWWPWSIQHGLNPFVTHMIWEPGGFNLTWATSIPGLSMLAGPVTLIWGPVVAYNVLALIMPALAASCAFLLCYYLSKSFWPSLAGGYVFGFSSYELAQLTAHLNLSTTFLMPLAVLIFLLNLDKRISRKAFFGLATLICWLQFSFSTELFATAIVFAVLSGVAAFLLTPQAERRALLEVAGIQALAIITALILQFPYLYNLFAANISHTLGNSPYVYSTDVLNFFVPTNLTLVTNDWSAGLSAKFSSFAWGRGGNYSEDGAYLGLPFIVILIMFVVSSWKSRRGRLVSILFFLLCICALGPVLHVAGIVKVNVLGKATLPIIMPWVLADHLPLIRYALPCRFPLYIFLILSIIVCLWAADSTIPRWMRCTLSMLALVFILPNVFSCHWASALVMPPFFKDGLYKKYVAAGDRVLILPFGCASFSDIWQVASSMHFRLVGGYVGSIPPHEENFKPMMQYLQNEYVSAVSKDQFAKFVTTHGVCEIVLVKPDNATYGSYEQLLSGINAERTDLGDVVVYQLRSNVP